MSLKDISAKLQDYQDRLKQGKAHKIQAKHVDKIIAKLTAKEAEVLAELDSVTKEGKRARLEQKLETLKAGHAKAEWLRDQL